MMEMTILWRVAFCIGFLIAGFASLVLGLLIAWLSRVLRDTTQALEGVSREVEQSLETVLEDLGKE